MIQCDQIRDQMSAALDGELDADLLQALSEHLEGCDDCDREWKLLVEVDQQLRRELVSPAACEIDRPIGPVVVASARTWTAAISVFGMAAAILICAAISWTKPAEAPHLRATNPDARQFAATLVHATGPVEVYDSDAGAWLAWAPEENPLLEYGVRLRTQSAVRCEFQTIKNGTVRLDEDAELVWKHADEVMLLKGRMWCVAPADESISVQLPVLAQNQIATFVCPSQSESHYATEPPMITCTSTSDENETVTAKFEAWSCSVNPGETVQIGNDQNVESDEQMVAVAKAWQLPLLASRESHAELNQSVTWLLSPIGYTKATHFNEKQIRALGPAGAIPLLAYVKHSGSEMSQQTTRRTAMQLTFDVADPSALPMLRELRSDDDEVVADLADRIIQRIQSPPE